MRLFLTFLLLAASCAASADPRADKLSWTDGGKTFDGYLVWDDASDAKRPGLVMVPNWYGVTDAAVEKAKVLAGKDYVILLADVYGRGVRPANPEEAGKASSAAGKAPVDAQRIGAIGFCFGGMVALELARSGADIDGVATFHANLSTQAPAKAGVLKAPVLVMNGADDKFVSAESIAAFEEEMRAAKADWQFVNYGGAVHCFAEPDEQDAVPGCRYHEPSYRRSVAQMQGFFGEAFAD